MTYAKGASVLRMLRDYVGSAAFCASVNCYLKDNLYGNVTAASLWKAFDSTTHMPIGEIMGSWTKQAGYPIVFVERDPKDTKRLVLRQRKYTTGLGPGKLRESADQTRWNIPVKIRGEGIAPFYVLLRDEETTVTIERTSPEQWICVNAGLIQKQSHDMG